MENTKKRRRHSSSRKKKKSKNLLAQASLFATAFIVGLIGFLVLEYTEEADLGYCILALSFILIAIIIYRFVKKLVLDE